MSSESEKIYEKIEIDLASFGCGNEKDMEFSEHLMLAILDNRNMLSTERVKIKLCRALEDNTNFIQTNIDEYCSYINASNPKKLILFLGMGITGNPNNYFLKKSANTLESIINYNIYSQVPTKIVKRNNSESRIMLPKLQLKTKTFEKNKIIFKNYYNAFSKKKDIPLQ